MTSKKIVIAVGGTGGHLFPAQGFAEELLQQMDVSVLFMGKGLNTNSYFDRNRFTHCDVESVTPFRGKRYKVLFAWYYLFKGVCQSLKQFSKHPPLLVVGFGSFHTFPVLLAAAIKRIPIVLFESNAMPGKVVRLFSKRAQVTGIYLDEARAHLKGRVVGVNIPLSGRFQRQKISPQEARAQLQLDLNKKTVLIFGGSQGAQKINEAVDQMLPLLSASGLEIQLIHLTGSEKMAERIKERCQILGISCYVQPFEKQMDLVLAAADVAVCRSGAMTVAELLYYQLPSLLIPYPFASDQHQRKNALFVQDTVKGAVCCDDREISGERMADELKLFFDQAGVKLHNMERAIHTFNQQPERPNLAGLVCSLLQEK